MPSKPVLTESAERLYEQLAPTYFREDEQYEWSGAYLISSFAKMLDPTAAVIQPSEPNAEELLTNPKQKNKPGYAVLMDPLHVEEKWLTWIAQFPGVNLESLNLTEPTQVAIARKWIAEPINWSRGTQKAIEEVTRATLSGGPENKTVVYIPRYENENEKEAFRVYVATFESETPNEKLTKEAAESMLPAWILLTYEKVKSHSMAELEIAGATEMKTLEALATEMKTLEEIG